MRTKTNSSDRDFPPENRYIAHVLGKILLVGELAKSARLLQSSILILLRDTSQHVPHIHGEGCQMVEIL